MSSHFAEDLTHLKRHLTSIEHMIFVSCKFTRTTEMIRKIMETIVVGYEQFFAIAYLNFLEKDDGGSQGPMQDKIQLLGDIFANRGVSLDLSDYFLLKKLLLSEFDCIGEYRKNLSMIFYINDEEFVINVPKLLDFYGNLKEVCTSLSKN